MCFICKSTFERFILLREVLNYVQTDDARTGVCSPYKLVSHTSAVCLGQVISSRFEVEVSSLYNLCKKKKKEKIIGCLLICTRQPVLSVQRSVRRLQLVNGVAGLGCVAGGQESLFHLRFALQVQ